MTRKELCQRLGVTAGKLAAWIREGLPHAKKGRAYEFDAAAVGKWLVDQGHAQPARTVKTLTEVATHFGRHYRTILQWKSQGMPCRDGCYDLDEIEAWREREGMVTSDEDRERAEIARIERETKQLKLDKLKGQVVDLDEARRLIVRHINESKALLDQLPDRVLSMLPRSVDGRQRARIRDGLVRLVDDTCQAIADTLTAPQLTPPDDGSDG